MGERGAVPRTGAWRARDHWPLYHDLRMVCLDLGCHASVAGRLAPALAALGVERLADVCRVSVSELTAFGGVGPRGASVARELGARP